MAKADPDDAARAAAAGFNMTPMIDVVFQLIIFLMLANDMSRKEIEDLELPDAIHASNDDGEKEKSRVIVNLLVNEKPGQPPLLRVKGQEMNLEEFKRFLRPVAGKNREPDGPRASELFVLIRADRHSRWQDVQWVMQACADPDIGIYKLQFATHNPQPDNTPAQ